MVSWLNGTITLHAPTHNRIKGKNNSRRETFYDRESFLFPSPLNKSGFWYATTSVWLDLLWHNKHRRTHNDMTDTLLTVLFYEGTEILSAEFLHVREHFERFAFPLSSPAPWWQAYPRVYIEEGPLVFILQHQKFLQPCCTVHRLFRAPFTVTDKPIFSRVYGLLENT